MATKLSPAFLQLAKSAMFNSSEWTPVGEPIKLDDFLALTNPDLVGQAKSAVITALDFNGDIALRMEVTFNDGSSVQFKINPKLYDEGDEIDVKTITCQELRKFGQDNIVRFQGNVIK
jgi:hypothetical protein